MRDKLEVRLLGRFELHYGRKTVSLSSRPAQSLFAFLVLHAGTAYRREKLAGQLWPDSTEESARDYLRHALWRIRKALQESSATEYLHADDIAISFDDSADYRLDVAELRSADEGSDPDALGEVLSSYQGELLPGFYDEWLVLEREEVEAVYEHKVAYLLNLLQEAGRWPEVLQWSEKWIAFGKRPEAAYRYLMAAYAAQGDMAKAAAAYERCRKALAEYGMELSEQTQSLYESIKSGGRTMGAAAALKSESHPVAAPGSNLPVPLTSFIGREKELREITRMLASVRLLTLTGPGGVGKTRLAIQVASNLPKKPKDGVFWIGLVGISDPNLIPQEIAQALHIYEIPPEPLIQTVIPHLKGREALLVIDNCEHLIKACAECAERLLAACPKLKILATSIEALGLFNEVTWQVPSLPLPAETASISIRDLREYASIELFRERAGNAKSGFALHDGNAKQVAEICQRLDGIPLAIELAAARIKVLTVDEIAARLDDRFSLLTSGSRTAIPRHQTLRATIDWSHELLSSHERILFRRLAVFAGGFTLQAAESICSDDELKPAEVLDALSRLVDRSLVIVDGEPVAGITRYRLLETIRQYALEKMMGAGEGQAIRVRHLEYYLRMAEEAEPNFYGKESPEWFRTLDRELDNIRAAVDWSTVSGKADVALRILGALVYFWFAHGLVGSEWNDRVQEALSRPEGKRRTLARAKALNGIGFMYWADIYPTDKRSELEEALSIAQEFGDPWNSAVALRNLGLLEETQGRYAAARTFLDESLEIWRAMGRPDKMGIANTLIFLGDVAFNQAEWSSARSLLEEAVEILTGPGDLNFLAYSVRRLGHIAWLEGDYESALARCKESLQLNRAVGDPRGTLASLAGFAAIAVAQARFERAAILMGAVENQLEAIRAKLLYVDRMEYERNLPKLRQGLSQKTLDKSWAKGMSLSLDDAISFALAES